MIRDNKHLENIRQLPCLYMSNECEGNVEACHIRYSTDGGMGLKPSDCYTIPMCQSCHRKQHNMGEVSFHEQYKGVWHATELAKSLYGKPLEEMKIKAWRFYNGGV
jgi:hypothetical protein